MAGLSTTTSAAWIGRSPGVCAAALPVSPRTPAAAADSMRSRNSRRVMAGIAGSPESLGPLVRSCRPSSRSAPAAARRRPWSGRPPRQSGRRTSPGFTLPSRSPTWKSSALPDVAMRAASAGVTPAATIISSSRRLSPCGKTPTSPPKHSVTPAFIASWNAARFALQPRRLRLLAFLPAGVLRRGVAGRERRTQRDTLLRHELPDVGRAAVAVLDRLDAAQDRAPHPFGRARVRRHVAAAALRHRDDRRDLLDAERGTRLAVRAPAIVGVDLHEVDAVADLSACHAGHAFDAVGFLGALRHRDSGAKPFGP